MKTKIIPFDLETAERIQAGEIKGKIKTRNLRYECTIVESCIYTEYTGQEKLLLVKFPAHDFEKEKLKVYHYDGKYMSEAYGEMWFDLVLEVPDEPQFKPFDKVLARDNERGSWRATFFSNYTGYMTYPYCTTSGLFTQCIPFEGNEGLVGTINKPKED